MSCCFYLLILQVFTTVYVSLHIHVLLCVNVPIMHVHVHISKLLMLKFIMFIKFVDHSKCCKLILYDHAPYMYYLYHNYYSILYMLLVYCTFQLLWSHLKPYCLPLAILKLLEEWLWHNYQLHNQYMVVTPISQCADA